MTKKNPVLAAEYSDIWLISGARTPFTPLNGELRDLSPTDLGIIAARGAIDRAAIPPAAIDVAIAANLAQASFDAYYFPRHVALYSGLSIESPALGVQRLCGSGFETVLQAADGAALGKFETAVCIGAESMSRNPISAYTHRTGFKMGQVEFKDFLWESFRDPASNTIMGETAENLAKEYGVTRDDADEYALRSFEMAVAAQASGRLAEEIVGVSSQDLERENYAPRRIRLPRGVDTVDADGHIRPTTRDRLSQLKPVFGGVQTAGNSSGIVDGAAACVVAKSEGAPQGAIATMVRAGAVAGVPPEIMGIGPVPAIRSVLEVAGLDIEDIDLFEINEAFAAQYIAVERALDIDRERVNVNGGAIAIGHPLAATGLRCLTSLALELRARNLRYGVGSACIGGGQGIAVLLENPSAD